MLSEFLDGELGDAERSDVTLHLEACADCARFAAELAATADALRRLLRGTAGLHGACRVPIEALRREEAGMVGSPGLVCASTPFNRGLTPR
jgi:anti-sigma factor RsiW